MRRLAVGALGGVVLALCMANPVAAAAPDATGWWNDLTVNGTPLPATTSADNLHIGLGPQGPVAYAAVRFAHTTAPAGAVLTLPVAANTTVGTPQVVACPTVGNWQPGGDQSWDERPAYSCATKAAGVLSADGTTLTFRLDAGLTGTGPSIGLALVPSPDDTTPFTLDLAKPTATALIANPHAISVPPPPPPPPVEHQRPPVVVPPPPAGIPVALPIVSIPKPSPVPAPPSIAPVAPAPALAAPVLATTPVPIHGPGPRGLAAVLLAGLVLATGYAMTRPTRAPVLIGGRARHTRADSPT